MSKNTPEYNSEYYTSNRDRILDRRRERYHTDEFYRDTIKSATSLRQKLQRLKNEDGNILIQHGVKEKAVSLYRVAKLTKIPYNKLKDLRKANVITPPDYNGASIYKGVNTPEVFGVSYILLLHYVLNRVTTKRVIKEILENYGNQEWAAVREEVYKVCQNLPKRDRKTK